MEAKNETHWQELIESTDFEQLSNADKAFVLGLSTENNYRLERSILLESKVIYQEIEPHALILEDEKKAIVIPLYQTILAVAASFVIGVFVFRSNGTTTNSQNVQTIASTDTVYVEKLIIDTVIQTKTEYIQRAAKKSVKKEVSPAQVNANPSSVLSNQSNFEADLSTTTLANKGTSASNDETLVLMEDWVAPN